VQTAYLFDDEYGDFHQDENRTMVVTHFLQNEIS
jgi:hypothetical protein